MHFTMRVIAMLLVLMCGLAWAREGAPKFTLTLPPDATPETMTVVYGVYDSKGWLTPLTITTQKGVLTYRLNVPTDVARVKLLIHRPGYRIVAAEIGKKDQAKSFTPQFIPLREQTAHLRLVNFSGKPIPDEHLSLHAPAWDEMTFFGFGGTINDYQGASIPVTIDAHGEAQVKLPAWSDDPYYQQYLKTTPTFAPITPPGQHWVYLPEAISALPDYPDAIVITKRFNATLTMRISNAYLKRQGIARKLGESLDDQHAVITLYNPTDRNGLTMHRIKDAFTEELPPGTYNIGLQVSTTQANGSRIIREFSVQKGVMLKEKEARTIRVE